MATTIKNQKSSAEMRLAVIQRALRSSQSDRMALLQRAGIVNSKGQLAKGYRSTKRKKS